MAMDRTVWYGRLCCRCRGALVVGESMTDRLGEALTDYDKWIADDRHTLPFETFEEVVAAARAWHTLTEGRALIIERDEKGEWPIKLRGLLGSWAHRWPELPANSVLDTLYDTLAVDALSDTAGPEVG